MFSVNRKHVLTLARLDLRDCILMPYALNDSYSKNGGIPMNMKTVLLSLVTVILAFCIFTGVYADAMEGMITRIMPDGTVLVNKGMNDGVSPEKVFFIIRGGKPFGAMRVNLVDEFTSVCQLLQTLGPVQVGDQFTDKTPAGSVPSPVASPAITEQKPEQKKAEDEEKAKQIKELEKKAQKEFESMTRARKKTISFKQGSGGSVKINPMNTYLLISPIINFGAGGGGAMNPYFTAWYVADMYNSYTGSKQFQKVKNLTIEITYWDKKYVDSYTSFYACKEVIFDQDKISDMSEKVAREKGILENYVFQVSVANPGPGPFQMAPAPWHIYMVDKSGLRHKAVRYDEILDKTLNPNQAVNGFMYFPRTNADGSPAYNCSSVSLMVEDILGKSKRIEFE